MSDLLETTPYDEVPTFFPAGDVAAFGIHTLPRGHPVRSGVLILSGGMAGTSTVGRNRMFVRLCRRLAGEGLGSMRFDYHGIGESMGGVEAFRLDAQQPFVDDIVGAARFLERQGIEHLVLVGKCFGSRMALAAAPALDRLEGVVLIGAPVRDFATRERTVTKLAAELSVWDHVRRALRPVSIRSLRQARRRKVYARIARAKVRALAAKVRGDRGPVGGGESRWISPGFVDPLESLVERETPVQLIYGDEDEFYEEFQQAIQEHARLRRLVESTLVEVTIVAGRVGDFVHLQAQDETLDAVCTWIRRNRAFASR